MIKQRNKMWVIDTKKLLDQLEVKFNPYDGYEYANGNILAEQIDSEEFTTESIINSIRTIIINSAVEIKGVELTGNKSFITKEMEEMESMYKIMSKTYYDKDSK